MSELTLKRAALRIAGLHPADRRWLLRQLPTTPRRRLTAMIRELDALGIEDPEVFLAALTPSAAPTMDAVPGDLEFALVDQLPPAWAMAALANESPAVRHAYIERCPEARRNDLASQPWQSLPPRLAATLQRRLRESSPIATHAAVGDTAAMSVDT